MQTNTTLFQPPQRPPPSYSSLEDAFIAAAAGSGCQGQSRSGMVNCVPAVSKLRLMLSLRGSLSLCVRRLENLPGSPSRCLQVWIMAEFVTVGLLTILPFGWLGPFLWETE